MANRIALSTFLALPAIALACAGSATGPDREQSPPDTITPQEYSLSRPLLQNNPGALLGGDDWQGYTGTSDVCREFFHIGGEDPCQTGYAELVSDPTFGQVVRAWQGVDPQTVSYGKSWGGVDKVWYRVLMKFQPGFELNDAGGGADAWKVVFGGYQREHTFTHSTCYIHSFDNYGGTESLLPGSRHAGDLCWSNVGQEWSDGEWYELIFYEERVSATHYRNRKWVRKATSGGDLISLTGDHPSDWRHAVGS